MQNLTAWMKVAPSLLGRAASDLVHPLLIRMSGDSRHADPTAFQVKEEQHVIGHQPSPGQHFHREEISSSQHVHVGRGHAATAGAAEEQRRKRQFLSTAGSPTAAQRQMKVTRQRDGLDHGQCLLRLASAAPPLHQRSRGTVQTACNVGCRFLGRSRNKIGTDRLPVHTFVVSRQNILGSDVQSLRIER